jgi:hypothetical protein
MIDIINETAFENHIRKDILLDILSKDSNYKLFDFKKSVDVLIARNGLNPNLFFIEIKYHKKNHGRLGFGHAKGGGFQPEVLKYNTDYFEKNLRWILGHEESNEYWFVDNTILRNYLNGNTVGEKYNGIKLSFFSEVISMNREELKLKINDWLEQS